ncbi:phosphoesterase PA-phosphatase related [Chthoniobacter flavus Ellin428]|uniref:Phosphoesterase PA-phosphatase related n=1 Tax=Chthoniobacter flavus Ellin428 TaxID=497964 RepID=B4CXE2_9BACT|nr:phosphatase PAP2 family protein [Chthoniobacter flavus]EDY20940.1 phosphoesterase PA-phosphatase related [Chthoniobacter flavus Ellin428]TCO88670.1 PAP2 superfamily protein [Chthoniobacter flavus]
MTQMLARLRIEWRWKLWLTVALNLVFWGGYELFGRHAFFPLRPVPMTWLDRHIPFQPSPWGWIYLSQFSFTAVVPWLLTTRDGIRRYVAGFVIMMVVSFLIYLFLPTIAPWPADGGSTVPMYIILHGSGPMNAIPSLHAAFLIYMGALAWRMFGRVTPFWVILVAIVWGGAILYSTIATRQHYALDLAAGMVLGWIADALAWRGASAAATMPVRVDSASCSGAR